MICKNCNTMNPDGASFCKGCGTPLTTDDAQTPPQNNFDGIQVPPPKDFEKTQTPPDNFWDTQTPPPDNFGTTQTPPPNNFGNTQTPPPNSFGGGQVPPNYGQPQYGNVQSFNSPENEGNPPKAIASLVLGITSLVGGCIPYLNFIAWILAIVGIILGAMSKKEKPTGMATAGIVCSIIALALDVILIILVFAIGMSVGLLRY